MGHTQSRTHTYRVTPNGGEAFVFEFNHATANEAVNALAEALGIDPESDWGVFDALHQIASVMHQPEGLRTTVGTILSQTAWATDLLGIHMEEIS